MNSLEEIDWLRKEKKGPISKTHPYRFTHLVTPKKRKIEEKTEETERRPLPLPGDSLHKTTKIVQSEKQSTSPGESLIKANIILSAYINLFFNASVSIIIILLAVKGIVMIKNDINIRMVASTENQHARIKDCKKQYYLNRCSPKERVPAMEKQCREWEICMKQDPVKQEIGRIVLRLVSEGAEELISALSNRSIIVSIIALVCILRYRR